MEFVKKYNPFPCLWCISILLGSVFFSTSLGANSKAEEGYSSIPTPLVTVLNTFEEKYKVVFSYDLSTINSIKVDFEFKAGETLEVAVKRLIAMTDLKYTSFGEKYFVIYQETKDGKRNAKKLSKHFKEIQKIENKGSRSKKLDSTAASNKAKEGRGLKLTGTVISEKDEPLIGVNVSIKGTGQGTTTDIDGHYNISILDPKSVLVVSYVGYLKQEIVIGRRPIIDIKLELDIHSLNEVVVIGYGSQKKANLTGAVSAISGESFEERPIVSAGAGLQGLIPNLNVTINNGDPTQAADYNIRGFESINGGFPLILVDGAPMDIERINPNDIQSVNVLKDAAASAVYGARAAFGVILVETKKGKNGKVNIHLGTEMALAKPIFNMDPITDPYQYVLARNQAAIRTNGRPDYDEDYIAGTKAWSENPDAAPEWGIVDGVLRFYGYNEYQSRIMTDFAPQQKYDMQISGANSNATYYVSMGILNKDGYLKPANNENFKRYNGLMKADFKINKWLSLEEKIVFNSQVSDKPHFYDRDVNINSLARVNPIQPIQFPDLEYYLQPGDRDQFEPFIGKYFDGTNFFPYLLDGGRETYTANDIWLTQGVTLEPFKGLKIQSDFSANSFHRNYQDVQSKVELVNTHVADEENLVNNGFSGDDWIINQSNYNQYYVLNAYAEYTLEKFDNHFLKGMVGFNQEWGRNSFQRAQARTLITPTVPDLNATIGPQETFGGKSQVSLRGLFYRLNYIYKDRYLLEANGRYDGTSRFPKDSRFGFFPSVSVGWRISNEEFMTATSSVLDDLKVRASFGMLGNQLLEGNYYPYISTMGIGSAPYIMNNSRIPFVTAAGLVSPFLTWETVVTQNIGVDFSLFKQKLEASFDFYTRETKDMLTDVEYPSILGTNAPQSNAADLRTTGWELSLTMREKIGDNWNFRLILALSDWISEVTKYDNPTGALSEFYEGQRIGEIWGYQTVGIFQTEEEIARAADQSRIGSNWRAGDIQYEDLNGDGIISPGSNTLQNPGDRTIIGNSEPRYSFGIQYRMSYKNWTLSTFFQGYLKRDHWPTDRNWTWFFPFNAGHVEKYFLTDTWNENNRDAYFPAPHISTIDKKNLQVQSRFIQDASYIRLKNISLSYELSPNLINKIGMKSAHIYIAGMNLWEFSKIRKPLDPETIYSGLIEYPLQRIYTIGAKVTF